MKPADQTVRYPGNLAMGNTCGWCGQDFDFTIDDAVVLVDPEPVEPVSSLSPEATRLAFFASLWRYELWHETCVQTEKPRPVAFTAAEREIIPFILASIGYREIAIKLQRSRSTVEARVRSMVGKIAPGTTGLGRPRPRNRIVVRAYLRSLGSEVFA